VYNVYYLPSKVKYYLKHNKDTCSMSKFWYVGIVGLANLSVLALLAILLFAYFVISSNTTEVFNRGSFRKKVAVYLLLALSVLAELPMYVGFITDNEYVKGYFGLHKLQSALLFSAFSIIIRYSDTLKPKPPNLT